MQERRNSTRLLIQPLAVKETNGDYLFSYQAKDLSEEGIFLLSRICVSSQAPFSDLTFTLPNGKQLRNIKARIIREERKTNQKGCAYEFVQLTEAQRMELKKFFVEKLEKTG